ncbi:MAG: gamma-glutamylcyclotransferase [Cyclobacteriaceae bacterium]|nr:gamma-glutamylcyclotransferase [Cyclobacteriaceae bacterium]
MNKNSMYAFYGSLRKGMQLHKKFESDLQYKFSIWLPGYKLYSLGPYPCAVQTQNIHNKILVEVMQIRNPDVAQQIFDIEINAGYFYKDIQIKNENVGIYLYKQPTNNSEVIGGDWVTFFGEQRK